MLTCRTSARNLRRVYYQKTTVEQEKGLIIGTGLIIWAVKARE